MKVRTIAIICCVTSLTLYLVAMASAQSGVQPDHRDAPLAVTDTVRTGPGGAPQGPETLCGADDRVASTDWRAGRLSNGCTAWLVSNGVLLTAGHCADDDPDDGGPMTPDGVLDWNADTVVEFNVPASNADGTINPAPATDRYTVTLTSARWQFAGEGLSNGQDWAVFQVQPNPITGKNPHEVYGFFRVTYQIPAVDSTIRITGYGTDNTPLGSTGNRNAQNQTNQTSVGPYSESGSGAGGAAWHRYRTDTMGGNSGSPIIWEANGHTIGIHDAGGCQPDNTGSNIGTSFGNINLQRAIQNFYGNDRYYVDKSHLSPFETGFVMEPFKSLTQAVNTVPNGVVIGIVANSYNESLTINKRVTLVAPAGLVTIGQ